MEIKDELIEALRTHDWYYRMSDDSRAYRRGQDKWDRIQFLADQLGDEGQELIEKYRKPIR